MQNLSHDEYLALIADATVLERDFHGDKVICLVDGSYIKLFRRKRLVSSAAWYPYARRFVDNARELALRGIPCPEVTGIFRVPAIHRDIVRYLPLAGKTLRQAIAAGEADAALRDSLARFVARLHGLGVYFRSLHLGNIILTPSGELGLIDIADLKAWRRPIPGFYRQRNLRHLYRAACDKTWLDSAGSTDFEQAYLAACADIA